MRVKSVRSAGKEPVYNMTVEEYHNYLIHGGIVLKNCDALRYFCVTRTLAAEKSELPATDDFPEVEEKTDYDDEMTGGEMTDDYLRYGGD